MGHDYTLDPNYPVDERVKTLMNIPQHEQRSDEWFEQRRTRLTSSDVDAVLGRNKYSSRESILFKKCGLSEPFDGNVATRHGQKYEDEAINLYCELKKKKSYSFGLLPHPTIKWLGGSPDDITHDGIVIEVKCPLYRKIKYGSIPEQYVSQVKMNMEIANLDKAVFIEYVPDCISNTGEYELNIVELDRDPKWFDSVLPSLQSFWDEVEKYRSEGIDKHPNYEYYYELVKKKNVVNFGDNTECMIQESSCDES